MKKSVKWLRPAALAACTLMAAATVTGGIAAMPHERVSAASSYTVDLSKVYQDFDGWGLSLSWWATEIGDWTRKGSSGMEKREEIAEALYGKTGLDLNIARYNIGGGDDPTHTHMSDDRNTPGWRLAHSEEFEDAEGGTYSATVVDEDYVFGSMDDPSSWLGWEETPDWKQLWVLDWIQNNPARAEDYISEFYSNSPPYWMTITGCSSGGVEKGQNLDFEYNQAFVEYFLDVYEYLTAQGFRLDNLQPFNESVDPDHRERSYWGENGDQEGCYFNAEQKVLILDLLRKELEARGLDVPYNWGDETNTNGANQEYDSAVAYNRNGVNGRDIVTGADRFTYHIYWRNTDGMQKFYRRAKSAGKELYMSEVSYQGSAEEYDPNDLSAGFEYTGGIVDTIKNGGVDAYVFWQGMEDMVGQIKGGTNWGLIQGVYYTQEEAEAMGTDLASMGLTYQDYVLSKSYYMSGQFTKYIRPGYRIVDVTDSNALAAVSPDGETLVIVKNNNGGADTVNYNLTGFKASSVERIFTDKTHSWEHSYLSTDGKSVSDSVPASSVVTYVIKGERTTGDGYFVDDSAFQNIGDMQTAQDELLDKGDVEQFYSNFDQGGGNSGHYGDTTYAQAGANKYAVLRFYGTGFALTAPQKNDAGQFDFYIDTLPASSDPAASVDLYRSEQLNGAIVYRNNSLEEDWHTVWLIPAQGSHGSWVNLDGVHIYTSHDTESEGNTPVITSASGVNGKVSINYTAEGFEDYTLTAEVLEQGAAAWRDTEMPLANGTGTFDVTGRSVRVRIKAEKDGQSVYSPVRVVEVLQIASKEGVLYYVDCGTADPGVMTAGAVLGELQSSFDRAYGTDPITGHKWGYKGTLKGEGYYADAEAMTSVAAGEKFEEGYIEYTFEIPKAGTYCFTLGFFGGEDGWGKRNVSVTVGSEKPVVVALSENSYNYHTVDITTAQDGENITVKVEKAAGESQSVLLSNIIIAQTDADPLPLYTDIPSNLNTLTSFQSKFVNIGEDMYSEAEKVEFTLTLSNGEEETYTGTSEGVAMVFNAGTMAAGSAASAVYTIGQYGIEARQPFRWAQDGAEILYYNIDIGFVDVGQTPPDDATLLGAYQTSTRDRIYGKDSGSGTSWGYVGNNSNNGVNWKDNQMNKWSIREGMDGDDKTLTYKMTGFRPNEPLKLETGGHCSNWSTREYEVDVNGTKVGSVMLFSNADPYAQPFTGANVKADENGEVTITYKRMEPLNQGVQVSHIKIWSIGKQLEAEPTLTLDKAEAKREDTVTVSGISEGAEVYMYDENRHLVGNFSSTEAVEGSKEIVLSELPEGLEELHLVQGSAQKSMSAEAVVTIEIEIGSDPVKFGEYAVVLIKPVVTKGVTALTLTTPDGAEIDLTGSFYFRTRQNGTYTVTLLSGGVETTEKFTVDTIDEVDFGANYGSGWTKDHVNLSFKPVAKVNELVSFAVDGQQVTLTEEGTYLLEVSKNGTHTATITTSAGFTYTETYTIDNIDASAPQLDLSLGFTLGEGLTLNFAATTQSGGALHVSLDGQEIDTIALTSGVVSLEEDGNYQLWFVNGAGAETQKVTYHVAHGTDKAQLATVSVGSDGALTVTGAEHKLYRAGEETALEKAEKAGRYYLELTKDGEKEIVVFSVLGAANETQGESEGGCGSVIAVNYGVIVLLAAACAVCLTLIVKGRKKS